MWKQLLIGGSLMLSMAAKAQNADVVRGEYWIDTDAGFGNEIAFSPALVPGADVTASITVPTSGLTTGFHVLGYRTLDDNGHWSLTNLRSLYVTDTSSTIVVRGEYWIDTDDGVGLGTPFSPPLVPGADIADVLVDLPTAGLDQGFHVLGYRTLDARGGWSLTNTRTLYVADSSSGVVIRAESFWDDDPGFGLGDPVAGWTPGADVADTFDVTVPASLDTGYHRLYVRTLDDRGRWSLTNWSMDTIHVMNIATGLLPVAMSTDINVYPNPFVDGLDLSLPDDVPTRVILYDPQGKLIHDRRLQGQSHIDLSSYARGTYTAFFWKDQDVIHRVTLIKQ